MYVTLQAWFITILPFMLFCVFILLYSVFQGMKLTAFEEDELMMKWQEILGPSNEVVVSFFFKVNSFLSCIKLYLPALSSWAVAS